VPLDHDFLAVFDEIEKMRVLFLGLRAGSTWLRHPRVTDHND
jgi:hypothetical protein